MIMEHSEITLDPQKNFEIKILSNRYTNKTYLLKIFRITNIS